MDGQVVMGIKLDLEGSVRRTSEVMAGMTGAREVYAESKLGAPQRCRGGPRKEARRRGQSGRKPGQ